MTRFDFYKDLYDKEIDRRKSINSDMTPTNWYNYRSYCLDILFLYKLLFENRYK